MLIAKVSIAMRQSAVIAIIALLLPVTIFAQQNPQQYINSKLTEAISLNTTDNHNIGEAANQHTAKAKVNPSENLVDNSLTLAATLRNLAQSERLNIFFDIKVQEMVETTRINFEQGEVTPLQRIKSLLDTYQLSYQPLDWRTIIVFAKQENYQSFVPLEDMISTANQLERGEKKIKPHRFQLHNYNFRDCPIGIIIRTFADQENLNIVFDNWITNLSKTKKIDFELTDTSAPRALKILLDANRLDYIQVGYRTILISLKTHVSSHVPNATLEDIILRADINEQLSSTSDDNSESKVILPPDQPKPATEVLIQPDQPKPPMLVAPQPGQPKRATIARLNRISATPPNTSDPGPTSVILRIIKFKIKTGQNSLAAVLLSSRESQLNLNNLTISLRYNPEVIKITAIHDGGLMSANSAKTEFTPTQKAGEITINFHRPADTLPVSSNGQLVLIYYQGIASGMADLAITGLNMSDANNNPLQVSIVNNAIEVVADGLGNMPQVNATDDDHDNQ